MLVNVELLAFSCSGELRMKNVLYTHFIILSDRQHDSDCLCKDLDLSNKRMHHGNKNGLSKCAYVDNNMHCYAVHHFTSKCLLQNL